MLPELTFCSTGSARQMDRGAGEPLLPGRQQAGAESWKGNSDLDWQEGIIEEIRVAFFSPSSWSCSKGMGSIFLCAFSGETGRNT